MPDNNKHENKTEALNEEARKTELFLEELEQVTGGKEQLVAPADGTSDMRTFTVSLSESK